MARVTRMRHNQVIIIIIIEIRYAQTYLCIILCIIKNNGVVYYIGMLYTYFNFEINKARARNSVAEPMQFARWIMILLCANECALLKSD